MEKLFQIGQGCVFIVGCSRSGTTILGEILNGHTAISNWYEPEFIWNKFTGNMHSDVRTEQQLKHSHKEYIRREFSLFKKKSKAKIVIDKSPLNSFKISYIKSVFPGAKWIHIIRDGRDVTLSLNKEWEKRRHIVEEMDFLSLFKVVKRMIKYQPFFRNRVQAVFHEINNSQSKNIRTVFNKSKWNGNVGYGARFHGWEDYHKTQTPLEFNAMQWVKSIEAINEEWSGIDSRNRLEIHYESLLGEPKRTINNIIDFLGCPREPDFVSNMPKLKQNNFNKWESGFNKSELSSILPILKPLLIKMGYHI